MMSGGVKESDLLRVAHEGLLGGEGRPVAKRMRRETSKVVTRGTRRSRRSARTLKERLDSSRTTKTYRNRERKPRDRGVKPKWTREPESGATIAIG